MSTNIDKLFFLAICRFLFYFFPVSIQTIELVRVLLLLGFFCLLFVCNIIFNHEFVLFFIRSDGDPDQVTEDIPIHFATGFQLDITNNLYQDF